MRKGSKAKERKKYQTLREFCAWALRANSREGLRECMEFCRLNKMKLPWRDVRENKMTYRTLREYMAAFGNTPDLKG